MTEERRHGLEALAQAMFEAAPIGVDEGIGWGDLNPYQHSEWLDAAQAALVHVGFPAGFVPEQNGVGQARLELLRYCDFGCDVSARPCCPGCEIHDALRALGAEVAK